MITLNDGRQVELIDVHSRQVDFRVVNAQYTGVCVTYAEVADPLPIDENITDPDEIVAALIDNLPSWSAVSTAVDNIANLADAKVFLKKLSRVVYWLAKNQ